MTKIFNVMMCRDLGGLQQVFLDYNEALDKEGYEVINIISNRSAIKKKLKPNSFLSLPNFFPWCLISKLYLATLIKKHQPSIIIAHGGRSINFSTFLPKEKRPPIVGVAHGYTAKRLKKCDYIIAITRKLREYMIDNNFPDQNIYVVNNTVKVDHDFLSPQKNQKVIIGVMARLEVNKGIQHLINAINILVKNSIHVELVVAGDGPSLPHLQGIVTKYRLESYVKFIGWIDDKEKFFKEIDIYCCPSEHEPFGMVVIEAMAHNVPVLATDSEGPGEIITHNKNGFIAKNKSMLDIAEKLEFMINDWSNTEKVCKQAYEEVKVKYNLNNLGSKLANVISKISENK